MIETLNQVDKKADKTEALMDVLGRYFDEKFPRGGNNQEIPDSGRITRDSFIRRHTSPTRVGRLIGYAMSITDKDKKPDWDNPTFQAEIAKRIFPRIADPNNSRVLTTIAFAKALTQ